MTWPDNPLDGYRGGSGALPRCQCPSSCSAGRAGRPSRLARQCPSSCLAGRAGRPSRLVCRSGRGAGSAGGIACRQGRGAGRAGRGGRGRRGGSCLPSSDCAEMVRFINTHTKQRGENTVRFANLSRKGFQWCCVGESEAGSMCCKLNKSRSVCGPHTAAGGAPHCQAKLSTFSSLGQWAGPLGIDSNNTSQSQMLQFLFDISCIATLRAPDVLSRL